MRCYYVYNVIYLSHLHECPCSSFLVLPASLIPTDSVLVLLHLPLIEMLIFSPSTHRLLYAVFILVVHIISGIHLHIILIPKIVPNVDSR